MNKVEFKFDNGQRVRDLVSGLTGIISASSLWFNGCIRYSIDSYWVDEKTLELVDEGINQKKIKKSNTGGPSEHSPKM